MFRHMVHAVTVAALALASVPAGAQVSLGGTRIYSPTKMVAPEYPAAAAQAHVRGEIDLFVHVDIEGHATRVEITKSFDGAAQYGLEQSAIAAVKQWEFGAGVQAGRIVPYTVSVSIDFPPTGPSAVRYEEGPTGRVKLSPPYADATPIETEGLVPPTLLFEQLPHYTSAGIRAHISGDVLLDIVVASDGTVAAARVARSLDAGLDANALDAVSQWRYSAGRLLGQPVPVRMTVSMTFRTSRPRLP